MTEFDDRLKAGMSADDQAFLNDLEGDDGMFVQMGATFSGPMRFWVFYAAILSFVLFFLALFGLYQMFQAETVREMILWSALLGFGMLAVGMIKMWFLMRMNHLAVLKELKKIELRLVQLGR